MSRFFLTANGFFVLRISEYPLCVSSLALSSRSAGFRIAAGPASYREKPARDQVRRIACRWKPVSCQLRRFVEQVTGIPEDCGAASCREIHAVDQHRRVLQGCGTVTPGVAGTHAQKKSRIAAARRACTSVFRCNGATRSSPPSACAATWRSGCRVPCAARSGLRCGR